MNEKRARTVLMPVEHWEKLKAFAEADRRKLNAQIMVLIDQEASRRAWGEAIAANREAQEA